MSNDLLGNLALARARQALEASGLANDGPMVRAHSTRNEVFLSDDYAIRLNRQPNERLRREAKLCHALPKRPWTPTVVAYGGGVGSDYLIVERREGSPLSRWWPDMRTSQRREAIAQLASCLRELHEIRSPASLPTIAKPPHMLRSGLQPTGPLWRGITALRRNRFVDADVLSLMESKLRRAEEALPEIDGNQLIHGDLSFENILWDGSTITGLLDFEWCRGGPADLDLDVLLRFCAIPKGHVAEDYEGATSAQDYVDVPMWLAAAYPDLFSHQQLAQRLFLFALSFEVAATLASPPERPRADLPRLHPYNRLTNLVATGGHITAALQSIGIEARLSH